MKHPTRTTHILGPRLGLILAPWRLLAGLRWLGEILRGIRRRRREAQAGALTVAVDAASLFEPLTGIGGYLYRLLAALAEREDLRLRLYGPEILDLPGGMAPAVPLPSGPAIEWVRLPAPDRQVPGHGLLTRWAQRLAPLLVSADGNRVLFAPNYLAPPHFRFCRGALVATIHDLSIEKVPWAVRPDARRALAVRLERTFLDAVALITPSEAVRGEIAAAGHFNPRAITTVHHGPGQISTGTEAGPSPAGGPAGPAHALIVGTLEPRKNLAFLLALWPELRSRLAAELPAAPPPALVLVGRYGWKTEALRRQVGRGIREGWLAHRQDVEAEELAALYRRATLVAFPTLYEGFGLPALEALASGVPLVASDLPVLREVAADAALYAPPDDPEAWIDALLRVLTDPALARDLARKGRERARAFSWARAAEETLAVWRRAGGDEPG